MKIGVLAIGCLGFVSAAWSQTGAITSIVNGLGQPRMSPGDVVSIYGSWPSGPKSNFMVTFGSLPAYITLAANDGKTNRGFQLDAQVPTELSPGGSTVVVTYPGGATPAFPVTIVPVDPVLGLDAFSTFLHTSGVAVQPAAPAASGETITTFMVGLGATNPSVPSGTQPAGFTPTAMPVTVTVGAASAQVVFAGRYADQSPLASLFPAISYQLSFLVPAGAASGPNTVTVSIGGIKSNPQTLFTGTAPLPSPPTVTGVVSGGNFSTSTPIAPGSFVSVFGTGFGTNDNLSAFPSTQVNGISVLFNGQPAPIFSLIASAGQINVLAPSDIPTTAETVHGVAVAVQNQNGPSKATFITPAAAGPSMFLATDPSNTARRNVSALFANTAWYVMPASQAQALGLPSCTGLPVTSRCGQPAKRGDFIQIYATGLGAATPNGDPNGIPLGTGQVAPADGNPVYRTVATPSVTVGGQPAPVVFSGIAPGFAGLYQVNFQIAQNAAPGDNVIVTLTMPGSSSDSATIAIQ